MIKIYGMEACGDCQNIKKQIVGRENEFEYIDLASSMAIMKAYLKLRDDNPVFSKVKEDGKVGIPYFVTEEETITLDPKEVGLKDTDASVFCSLEDHLKGVKGC